MPEFLAILVSVISAIVAILAYRRSRIGEEASAKYNEIQKEVAELQLIQLRLQANVILSFKTEYHSDILGSAPVQKLHRFYYLIIKNLGTAEARDINIRIESSSSDRSLPAQLQEIQPISILGSGIDFPIAFGLKESDSIEFSAFWEWKNPDGMTEKKHSILKIQDSSGQWH